MRSLRFSLMSVFVVMTVASLLLWANVHQRVVVSHSPSAFGLPNCVSIHFLQGWPVVHTGTSFLVMRDEAARFIEDYPESARGADPPSLKFNPFVIDVVAAVICMAIAGFFSEWVVRRFNQGHQSVLQTPLA